MSGPIKPSEIGVRKDIPDYVYEIVNNLITRHFDNGRAVVKQDEIVNAIAAHSGLRRAEVFEAGWLDFETSYRIAGWKVEYERPGYNETGDTYFTFTAKEKQ